MTRAPCANPSFPELPFSSSHAPHRNTAQPLRGEHSLADLYDRITIPPELRKAHQALAVAVDKLYRSQPFADDRERVECLLGLYEAMTSPLLALAQKKPKRGSARK